MKMVHLNERERIEILMMVGFGDRVGTHEEVCHLFNDLNPERIPITRSAITKTLKRFSMTGTIKKLPKTGRLQTATNAVVRGNIGIELKESLQTLPQL